MLRLQKRDINQAFFSTFFIIHLQWTFITHTYTHTHTHIELTAAAGIAAGGADAVSIVGDVAGRRRLRHGEGCAVVWRWR